MTLWSDIRLATRLLVKDRSFTLAALAALALGIAANATVFTLVNGVLLRSLPFDAPDRIVVLNTRLQSNPDSNFPISYLELLDWQAGARSYEGIAGFTDATINIADDDQQPERLLGAFVSANTFALIGQRPILGRHFRVEDDRVGAEPVVMLGHSAWQRRFASNPGVIGRRIRVNGVSSTVIGVMPEGFGLWTPRSSLVSAPTEPAPSGGRGMSIAQTIGGRCRLAGSLLLTKV